MARKQRCSKCNKLSDPYNWSLVRRAGSTVARRECPKCVEKAKKEKGTLVVSDWEGEMSYDISLVKDSNICQVNNHQEGGVVALGGSSDADINITYNYSFFFYNFLDKRKGIRWLYGKTAQETIPRLEKAIEKLSWRMAGGVYEKDYWAPTFGNARRALEVLLEWAKQHPNGIWEGD